MPDNPRTASPIFMAGCRNAIDMLRRARVDDAIIASVLFEVRAATITEIDLWQSQVKHENPVALPPPSEILRHFSD